MQRAARQWFADRTSHAEDWPAERLCPQKGDTQVSVVLPALNEEATVGNIVERIAAFADRTRLVDEIVVMDSGSTDRTAAVATAAGATVWHRDEVLPEFGSRPGKGEVLWKSLAVTKGDLVVYVDADLTDFGEHYLTGLLGPLLTDPGVMLVKGFYDRPLGGSDPSAGGGRVTELLARPLLNAFFPELAGVVQPLGGEYAGRRSLLEQIPFAAGYGVEVAMLIDTVRRCGLDALAQVDLDRRAHHHQDIAALGRMAATILHTVLHRLPPGTGPAWQELTQFQRGRNPDSIECVDVEVTWPDRPPIASLPIAAPRPASVPATADRPPASRSLFRVRIRGSAQGSDPKQ